MESTFDDKVYDIPDPDPDPDPDIEFDDVYPVGTIITTKTQTYRLTQGTWQLTGMYGVGSTSSIPYITFDKDHVLCHMMIDAAGSTQFKINFNDTFGDCTVKYFLGPSYRSPQNASSPGENVYSRFYDDKGGWYAIIDSSSITVKGAGLADRTRKFDLTVLVQLNTFDQALQTFSHNDISYEFLRTA